MGAFGLIEGVALVDILALLGVVVFRDVRFSTGAFGCDGLVNGPSAKSPQFPKESSSSNDFDGVVLWTGGCGDFGGIGFAD